MKKKRVYELAAKIGRRNDFNAKASAPFVFHRCNRFVDAILYHTRQAFSGTMGCPALQLNAF